MAHVHRAEPDAFEEIALAAELRTAEYLHLQLAARELLGDLLELERAILVRERHRCVVRELEDGLLLCGGGSRNQGDGRGKHE